MLQIVAANSPILRIQLHNILSSSRRETHKMVLDHYRKERANHLLRQEQNSDSGKPETCKDFDVVCFCND